jgi:hypothetical protein
MGKQIRYTQNKEDDYTRKILDNIRKIEESSRRENEKKLLKEETEEKETSDGIAITDAPIFGQNTLTNQINQFRTSVESGAQFAKPNDENVSESPLIFMPNENNLIFSGVIPCLNNLKFQFKLRTNTGDGCFLTTNGLVLNDKNLEILNKLYGFYENWKEQWNMESSTLEQMANHIRDNK